MQNWEQEELWVTRSEHGVIIGVQEKSPQGLNKNDVQRKNDLIKALIRATEKAKSVQLYLTANDRCIEELWIVEDVLESINNALERLGAMSYE